MNRKRLQKTLRQLAGHLIVDSKEKQRQFDSLSELMVHADLPEDTKLLIQSDLSIDKADFFFDDTIPKRRTDALDALVERIGGRADAPRFRMFTREIPIREPLLNASVPPWAAGARASETVGPFEHGDGRRFWFDFYPVLKLVALFIQGISEPVLLFRPSQTGSRLRKQPNPVPVPTAWSLASGTIWIQARVLAPSSPQGTYVGLRVDGGRISLSSTPLWQEGMVTVAANTTVSVRLDLEQGDVEDAEENGDHGQDARDLTLRLPDRLELHFSGQGRQIDKVGGAGWRLFGERLEFAWDAQAQTTYDPVLKRVVFPFTASENALSIRECRSRTHRLRGEAEITRCAWALPVASIDVSQPTEASGIGAMLVQTGKGLTHQWLGLEGGGLHLAHPVVLASPGLIFLADLTGGNPHARQTLDLWRDERNPFGSTVELTFPQPALFFFASHVNGTELLMTFVNADFRVDRPVKVDGEPPGIHSVNSLLMLAVSSDGNLVYLFDDDMILDALLDQQGAPAATEPFALALKNALFRVTPPNGCLLFGTLSDDFGEVERGFLFLTFGLLAYLPTLPDPYAANLGVLRGQIRGRRTPDTPTAALASIAAWLVCRVRWEPDIGQEGGNEVEVSFHFAPLASQFGGIPLEGVTDEDTSADTGSSAPQGLEAAANASGGSDIRHLNDEIGNAIAAHNRSGAGPRPETEATLGAGVASALMASIDSHYKPLPDYEAIWNRSTQPLQRHLFALLDVSTNADLFGVSFDWRSRREKAVTTHVPVATTGSGFPIQVRGLDVISQGQNVKAFTVPQISWEPLINLSLIPPIPGDPPTGPNYFPNDGGPTQILNESEETVVLAPIPVARHLVDGFSEHPESFVAYALTTLPFGMRALALLQDEYSYTDGHGGTHTRDGSKVRFNAEDFEDEVKGGLQLRLDGGKALIEDQSDMFFGNTLQLNNVLDLLGNSTGASTLGRTVTEVFNNEFSLKPPALIRPRGVPVTRVDLSGYGASAFSDWLNPTAAFAETSQARFDIFVGRCAHEIVQIKSIIYPWGIRVVRTITIFRVGSGYVYRFDSGWKAESNGEFNFRYFVNLTPDKKQEPPPPAPSPAFRIHPGIIRGLFNVQNILETEEVAQAAGRMQSAKMIDEAGLYRNNSDPSGKLDYKLQPVFFDADVEIEGLVSGFTKKAIDGKDRNVVPSKKVLGYVQVEPRGLPIDAATLRQLVVLQQGSIGGPIDCEIDLAGSGQKMRLGRFDFSNSVAANGVDPAFVVAGRGSVLLPKEGSWSMVKHERGTGEVTPVPADLSVPVIREGELVKDGESGVKLGTPPATVLLRIANPSELLRSPTDDTLNYGLLQSTDTQKALFLTPAFETGVKRLLSKTDPLFADAFRIVNSKAVFPNVGNAESDFGDAISLVKDTGTSLFPKGGLQDLGKDVWEIMDITTAAGNIAEQGFKLLKNNPVKSFGLPSSEFELIDLGDGNFRIYIEYDRKDKHGNVTTKGDLDFDIDSTAASVADTWKSRMGNIGLVVDLAGIERLMTIRGSWDSKKGAEATYPKPELVFADELQPVIDILEILQKLQTGDYAAAVSGGLKLAMSNKAGTWEYKLEASKEIPVLRFPVPDAVYNDPNTPFKLEAGLKLGAYFNAALKVTTDAHELLPSAGGLLGFYGRLSVMCVSLSAATIYAIGQVNLDIAADTKIGPSLRMKFGFGAQIVVGLPVAGNVSVLYVVAVEIYAATGIVEASAFLLFEGHAEILGGIVAITIRIEAKGTVSRKTLPPPSSGSRADLACQVTFGLDISIFLVININFETSWTEQRQIA